MTHITYHQISQEPLGAQKWFTAPWNQHAQPNPMVYCVGSQASSFGQNRPKSAKKSQTLQKCKYLKCPMVPSRGQYLHLNFTICTLEKALNLNLFWLLPEIFNFLVGNPETIFQDSQIWSSGSAFLIFLRAEMDSAEKVGGIKVVLDFLNSYSFYGNLHASIFWAEIVKNFYFWPF